MRTLRIRATAIIGLLCLALLAATPVAAAPGGNANGGTNGNRGTNGNGGNSPPALSATPELDSLVLFGSGAVAIAGYALMRVRARRRQDKDTD